MLRRSAQKLALQAGGLLVIAGVVTLGILQFRWISNSVVAERVRSQNDLNLSVGSVIEDSYDEVRAMLSFVYLTPDDVNQKNWKKADSSIKFWKDSAQFPSLLGHVYIVPTNSNGSYYRYDPTTGNFDVINPPASLEPIEAALDSDTPALAYPQAILSLEQENIVVVPISDPTQQSNRNTDFLYQTANSAGLLAIEVNSDVLYKQIIPYFMNHLADKYFYSVVLDGKTVVSTLPAGGGPRRPDLVISLRGAYGISLSRTNQPGGSANVPAGPSAPPPPGGAATVTDGGPVLVTRTYLGTGRQESGNATNAERDGYVAGGNPISRFWFLRTMGMTGPNTTDVENRSHSLPPERLVVYYPARSLQNTMEVRRSTDLAISLGTLLLLLTGYAVLYRLVNRTQAMRVREKDFVASMTHELRTPISVIQATSDNLVHGVVVEPMRVAHYGTLIQLQAVRLGRMVENILLYSALEFDISESRARKEFDLSELIEETTGSFRSVVQEAGATLTVSGEEGLGMVTSDPDALRIVIGNLIMNAIRHGIDPEEAENGKAQIRVSVRIRPPATLQVTVEDDGPGIDPSEVKTIFDPFVRGASSRNDQHPGSGLGLHLVKRITERLGGKVLVESPYETMAGTVKRGSRFIVRIPLKRYGN